jgi:uncharacterized protein (DUF1330 family)
VALAVVLHRVEDYPVWRTVYDAVAETQKAGGVLRESVHRMSGDPDNVLVLHEFATVEEAHEFFDSAELRDVMKEAGVLGEPRIEIYH